MRNQQKPPDDSQADKFGWESGDLEIIRPGTGDPLISEEEMARILRENGPPRRVPHPNDQEAEDHTAFDDAHRQFIETGKKPR